MWVYKVFWNVNKNIILNAQVYLFFLDRTAVILIKLLVLNSIICLCITKGNLTIIFLDTMLGDNFL